MLVRFQGRSYQTLSTGRLGRLRRGLDRPASPARDCDGGLDRSEWVQHPEYSPAGCGGVPGRAGGTGLPSRPLGCHAGRPRLSRDDGLQRRRLEPAPLAVGLVARRCLPPHRVRAGSAPSEWGRTARRAAGRAAKAGEGDNLLGVLGMELESHRGRPGDAASGWRSPWTTWARARSWACASAGLLRRKTTIAIANFTSRRGGWYAGGPLQGLCGTGRSTAHRPGRPFAPADPDAGVVRLAASGGSSTPPPSWAVCCGGCGSCVQPTWPPGWGVLLLGVIPLAVGDIDNGQANPCCSACYWSTRPPRRGASGELGRAAVTRGLLCSRLYPVALALLLAGGLPAHFAPGAS